MKKLYIIILIVFLGVSCSEDFLDRGPLAEQTSETFYNNDENAMSALYATYNVIRARETFGCNKWVLGSIASDLAEGGGNPGGNDILPIQQIDRLTHNAGNIMVIEWYWYGFYAGLLRANLVIENVEDNEAVSPATRQRIVGEAYCLRALFHFELVTAFGGVPIVDHVLSSEEYSSPVRNTIAEVFDQIESDLDMSIQYLTPSAGQRIAGRVDISSALALKVKALVYESSYSELNDPNSLFGGCENRWADAVTVAEQLISNSNAYGVGLDPDYAQIWRQASDGSAEQLISASSLKLTNYEGGRVGNGDGNAYEYGPSTNAMASIFQMPRSYYPDANAAENQESLAATDGWGFNVPTPKYVEMFNPDDPRLAASVVSDGDPWNYWDYGNVFLSTDQSPTGYSCKKYVMYGDEFSPLDANPHGSNLDVKILRYADFLLLAAEANLKNGNPGRATELINQVRTRARESGTTGEPANYNTNVTMDDILTERVLELGCEGHRFFDLVRTGNTDELDGANNYNETIQQELNFIEGTHEFFPIPSSEIVSSSGSLTQNNGY
jgi:hypothetical protein